MQREKSIQYYSAVLIFESRCPAPDYDVLYEEQIVLLTADSEAQAKEKALAYAKREEHSYQNSDNETITISLKQLLDIQSLLYAGEPIDHGTEAYSRFFRDYGAYEAFEPLLKGKPL